MRLLVGSLVVGALVCMVSAVGAAELKSGLQAGDEVQPFNVVKCSGAIDDGVKLGEELCYRCRYGNKPVVMVFARQTDPALATLVKELDQLIAKNESKKFSAFVNLIGTDQKALEVKAKELGTKNKVERVPVVVPVDLPNGPESYKINPEANVTVLIYKNGTVEANHAIAGKLAEDHVKSIVADTAKILN